jgi:hypothetical protein
MSWKKAALLLCCLVVGCLDLTTTNMILERGGSELNPFMGFAQTWLGTWWLIPKLGTIFMVMWLLNRSNRLHHIAFVVAVMSTPALSNLRVIAGMT